MHFNFLFFTIFRFEGVLQKLQKGDKNREAEIFMLREGSPDFTPIRENRRESPQPFLEKQYYILNQAIDKSFNRANLEILFEEKNFEKRMDR